jgi:hypothetical protein
MLSQSPPSHEVGQAYPAPAWKQGGPPLLFHHRLTLLSLLSLPPSPTPCLPSSNTAVLIHRPPSWPRAPLHRPSPLPPGCRSTHRPQHRVELHPGTLLPPQANDSTSSARVHCPSSTRSPPPVTNRPHRRWSSSSALVHRRRDPASVSPFLHNRHHPHPPIEFPLAPTWSWATPSPPPRRRPVRIWW